MRLFVAIPSGWLLAGLVATLALALPALLLWTSWTALRTQQQQKRIYLQSRIGALADRLETLPEMSEADLIEVLSAEEPALVGLRILARRSEGDGLGDLWDGRQLFLLEQRRSQQGDILRAFVPFHSRGRLCIARIELRADAADFIVQPARRNLAASAVSSLALVVLSMLLWQAIQARQKALLRQAELDHMARLGRLSAVLAHEIRNPLGTIKGFAQLLVEQAPRAQQALARPIVAEAERLERLVSDLLAYGRPRQPDLAPVPLRAALDELLDSFRRGAGPVHLVWDPDSVPPQFRMETDPGMLKQILLNLLRNAAEACAGCERPEVSLVVRAGAKDVIFEVRDNGPGFSKEALQRAFEPFFTTRSSGTGLGLAISARLARLLGGTLEVANAGGGAVATLRLPVRGARNPLHHPLHS